MSKSENKTISLSCACNASGTKWFIKVAIFLSGLFSYQLQAQESGSARTVLEEIVVTAQRAEEGLQDVPIAVTALTGDILDERQVINASDLQLNTPNVSFTATNFGNSSFSIRGVGRLVISTSGESGVSTHTNEIPITSNQNAIEYFDVERVEILRGPQGTLFGRNATGGAINVVTKMPDFEDFSGFADGEIGDYDHRRFKGAVNVPLSDRVAFRVAGMVLKRDGYIENLAAGQLPRDAAGELVEGGEPLSGIDDDVDGRDLWTLRSTMLFDISDNASLWIQHNYFEEDDDRVRITNQVCKRTALPTTGCEANEEAFEAPHTGTSTGAIFAMFAGALPLGASGDGNMAPVAPIPGVFAGAPALTYAYPRPALGYRSMHTDFEPVFKQEEESTLLGFSFSAGDYDFGILAGYQEAEYFSRQDYNMDVGATLNPTATNPTGMWPTAQIPSGVHGDLSGPCALEVLSADGSVTGEGNAGTVARVPQCAHPSDQTRIFSYDQSDSKNEYATIEGTIASSYDGRFNFTAGISAYESEIRTDYYVVSNTLDLAANPGIGPTPGATTVVYPGYFNSRTDLLDQDGFAVFGEVYIDITDTFKLTAGLRYNEDNKDVTDSGVLANSIFLGGRFYRTALAGVLGASNAIGMAVGPDPMNPVSPAGLVAGARALYGALTANQVNANLLDLYATAAQREAVSTALAAAATLGDNDLTNDDAAVAAIAGIAGHAATMAGQVPIVPRPGEARTINGNPHEFSWEEWTGRIGVDWNITDNSLVYAFYSRGYKPGGANPNIPVELRGQALASFDSETVDAFEVGIKNTLLDGTLTLNATAFIYDYADLQVTRIVSNSSINENIDAEISGVELEINWLATPSFALDFSYSYLDTAVDGSESIDPIGRTGGQDGWVILQDIDAGAATGVNFIAREAEITEAIVADARTCGNAAANDADTCIDNPANPGTTNNATFYLSPSLIPGLPETLYPANDAGVRIPAYFSRSFLRGAGVEVSDGNPVSLDGNQLPNSPEHTVHLGATYTWQLPDTGGDLSLRWDWYWQSESYAREFNTRNDKIEAWDQHNMSLIYNTSDGRMQARVWVRNIADDDNVTGKYLTADTSGFYRNHFLTEPRIFGASVRYNFGR